ncbi:glycerophosphodiester phosphodiesterase family protein [Conexibacter sp. SYSU D00693]|uniref:glycerophosphodiester phosphodiesterase family protein n=1 Tax=Conexibacter sp. SYSU D00693 TaxID=2812560 RepID=UPI00196BB027|nr:glycerophosphodiester phosphodiesterase family protein [Conexibacter sp. SYSU D00693]
MRLLVVTALALLAGAAPAWALPSSRVSPLRTDFLDVAHRGASGLAPEHTFAAYDLALALGADVIEQDVAPTADGQLVVLHDDTLDRTTDCTGRPEQKTLAELKRCDAGSWFNERYPSRARPEYVGQRIPTLDEVLTRYGDSVNFYIETKIYENGGELERKTLEALRRHGLEDRAVTDRQVFLQSFLPQHLLRMQAWAPRIPRVFLLQGLLAPVNPVEIAFAQGVGAAGIGPTDVEVTKRFVDDAHAAGLQVHPYTVDEAEDMARLQRLGVDGVFTNRPDVLERRRGLFGAGPSKVLRGRVRSLWRLPASTVAAGPPAGAALAGSLLAGAVAPLPGQPVAGISGIVRDGARGFLVLPDDQWDTPRRAADVQLRVYGVRTAGGRAAVTRTIVLRGPDGTPLTGAQYDPEALARTPDGALWVGEERGPSVLRFTPDGRQTGEPIRLPGLTTPWAQGAWPGNALSPREVGGEAPAKLRPSRGVQGLVWTHGGRRLIALVAGPVIGEADPRTRLLVELDARAMRPTGRRWRFRVAAPGDVAADLARVDDDRVLVVDRDTRGGRDARQKVVLRVDLRRRGVDGHARATPVLDLLELRTAEGRGFAMPFAEVDALTRVPGGVAVANDNDLPFGSARTPGRPDDTEIAVIDPERTLTR